jgi:DNA-3-methyladenine glycosylase
MKVLSRSFFARSPLVVAPHLLGKVLARQWQGQLLTGRIVEVEAYLAEGDEASHSFRGQTKRNASMFKEAGHAYVYSIHQQKCVNVVTETVNVASAVLIRALEPLTGVEQMRAWRQRDRLTDLTTGPGKLTQALHITLELDGIDLTDPNSELYIVDDGYRVGSITKTKRVGISKAVDQPYRFYLTDNQFISRK